MSNSLKVFAGTAGKKLANKIVAYLDIPLGIQLSTILVMVKSG